MAVAVVRVVFASVNYQRHIEPGGGSGRNLLVNWIGCHLAYASATFPETVTTRDSALENLAAKIGSKVCAPSHVEE